MSASGTDIRKERRKRKKTLGPNMAWWNKWLSRMEEEALSTKLMKKQRTIPTFMSISTKYEGVGQRRKIFAPGKVWKNQLNLSEENAGVVNERHPRSMPRTITNNSAISFVNGAKLE